MGYFLTQKMPWARQGLGATPEGVGAKTPARKTITAPSVTGKLAAPPEGGPGHWEMQNGKYVWIRDKVAQAGQVQGRWVADPAQPNQPPVFVPDDPTAEMPGSPQIDPGGGVAPPAPPAATTAGFFSPTMLAVAGAAVYLLFFRRR